MNELIIQNILPLKWWASCLGACCLMIKKPSLVADGNSVFMGEAQVVGKRLRNEKESRSKFFQHFSNWKSLNLNNQYYTLGRNTIHSYFCTLSDFETDAPEKTEKRQTKDFSSSTQT